MKNWEVKKKLIAIKREYFQTGKKIQDFINELDGDKKEPSGNSKNYNSPDNHGRSYREDRGR